MTVLVGKVVAVDAADRPGRPSVSAEFAKDVASAVVTLDNGRTCGIDPDKAEAPHHLRMLKMLSHAGMPVYLEMDAARNVVDRLLIPGLYQVKGIAPQPVEDRLEVDLRVSHSVDYVAMTNPDSGRIIDVLRTAREEGATVLVTQEPARGEIIDARITGLARPTGDSRPRAELTEAAAAPAEITELTSAEAHFAFDLVNAQSCTTILTGFTCIPFLYPDQGCWARAHEMCRLLIANGITPRKVWSYGRRQAATVNHPACSVEWGWHMAPVLGDDLTSGGFVIDPSLCDGPVTVAEWLARQPVIPPAAADDLEFTDASIYFTPRVSPTGAVVHDQFYTGTTFDLNRFRLLLANRCAITDPPGPPYQNCL